MRLYESTFILSPQADDAAFDRQIKAVSDVISRYQGKVVHEDRWGIRRLAYPIKKFNQGFYTRIVFEGNKKVLSELERFYKLEEPYIRYLTVLFEGKLEEKSEHRVPGRKPDYHQRETEEKPDTKKEEETAEKADSHEKKVASETGDADSDTQPINTETGETAEKGDTEDKETE